MITEEWLRESGHTKAADERARTKRTARIRLDRMLGVGQVAGNGRPCPGKFGPDGKWRQHCRDCAGVT